MGRKFAQLDLLILLYVGRVVDGVEEVGVNSDEDGAHICVDLAVFEACPQCLHHG